MGACGPDSELWNLNTPGASYPLADNPTIFHPNLGTEMGLWCQADMGTRSLVGTGTRLITMVSRRSEEEAKPLTCSKSCVQEQT